jgi:radical SAM superfamily enzyme YgiQ (UPF0313 family)
MKVLLISSNRDESYMRTWPLGLACVAAATRRAGHHVSLLDLMSAEDPLDALKDAVETLRPEAVAFSVRNIDDQHMGHATFFLDEVKGLIAYCKKLTQAPIVLGGPGYSMYPMSSLEYLGADMGIQGEGEAAFLALVGRLETGADLTGVPGLYLPRRGLMGERKFESDLDEFPLPGTDVFQDSISTSAEFWFPVQTRRGCAMRCSYCSTATIEGCRLRKRSPQRVVQWLAEWVEIGCRRFYFVDNTFNLPPSYAKALCSEMIAADPGIRWRCILYPIRIDEALVQSMAAAGCEEVSVGFESGSELMLHGMRKRFKPNDVRETSNLLKVHGIRRMGFLLLGGPGETRESCLESLAFAESLDLESVKLTVGIRIYPDTVLAKTAVEEKIIDPSDDLLRPRFYIAPDLREWLPETAKEWSTTHPNWMM